MKENWNIIPISKNSKKPLVNWKDYQTQKYSKEKLALFKDYNFAVMCGITSDNLLIFDLDYKDNNKQYFTQIFHKFIEKLPKLAQTYIEETPNGHHFFYYIKGECPKRSPRQDSKKNTILNSLRNGRNPTFQKVTNFPNLLKGVDILGQNGYSIVAPSKFSEGEYKPMNEYKIQKISLPVFNKLLKFFLREEPLRRRMREPFFKLLTGEIEIEEQSTITGNKEHVYWKYLFLEAHHCLELRPEEVFEFLQKNQPAFDLEKTKTQLQYVNFTNKPMTTEVLMNYFPNFKKKEENKPIKIDEPEYLTIANKLKEKFDLVTIDDCDEIMIRRGNVYSPNTIDLYNEMGRIIKSYNKSYSYLRGNVLKYIKDTTRFSRENFCYESWIINFKNGYYNVKDNTFYPKDDYKDKLFCYEIPHNLDITYFKRADICETELERKFCHCPKFRKLLQEWLEVGGKIKTADIFEMIGYSMTMNTDMKMAFFIYGPPHTGKTQFQTILEGIIGHENRIDVPLQRLGKNEFGSWGMEFKVLNMVGDMSSFSPNDISKFKTLTGNDKYVRAEPKNGKAYMFRNILKMWFNANKLTLLEEHEAAFYERCMPILFPNQFPMYDKNTIKGIGESILQDPDEIQGIIHESIKGLKRLLKRNYFRKQIIDNTEYVWRSQAEPLYAFIHDRCIITESGEILFNKFMRSYNKFLYKRGERSIHSGKLKDQMEKFGIYKERIQEEGYRDFYFIGIRWRKQPKIDEF